LCQQGVHAPYVASDPRNYQRRCCSASETLKTANLQPLEKLFAERMLAMLRRKRRLADHAALDDEQPPLSDIGG